MYGLIYQDKSGLNYSGRNGRQTFTDVDGLRLIMVQIKEYYFSNHEDEKCA